MTLAAQISIGADGRNQDCEAVSVSSLHIASMYFLVDKSGIKLFPHTHDHHVVSLVDTPFSIQNIWAFKLNFTMKFNRNHSHQYLTYGPNLVILV